MLDKDSQISELYFLKTKWNFNPNRHFPWEDNMFKKTVSPMLFNNPNLQSFLLKLQRNVALMVESVNIVRNYFNIAVSKYYNDQWN